MDTNKINLKNSPKLIKKKSSKNTQETRARAITHQEHAPCIGIWKPSAWALYSVLGVCTVHACTPNAPQWVYTNVRRMPS